MCYLLGGRGGTSFSLMIPSSSSPLFYFEIILVFKKRCKDSTENSLIPLRLTSYILHGKRIETKIITLVKYYLTRWILFIFPQFSLMSLCCSSV